MTPLSLDRLIELLTDEVGRAKAHTGTIRPRLLGETDDGDVLSAEVMNPEEASSAEDFLFSLREICRKCKFISVAVAAEGRCAFLAMDSKEAGEVRNGRIPDMDKLDPQPGAVLISAENLRGETRTALVLISQICPGIVSGFVLPPDAMGAEFSNPFRHLLSGRNTN